MDSICSRLRASACVGEEWGQTKRIRTMTVQKLRRTDSVLTEQFAQPCQQDFQPSGFGRLLDEQSLLYGLRTCRLRLHVQGDDRGLRWMHLQVELN